MGSEIQAGSASLFEGLDIPPERYLKRFGLPIISFGVILSIIMLFLLGDIFTGSAKIIVYFLPLFCVLFVLVYPKMQLDAKRVQIEQNLHYFITHMGVLATSDMPLTAVLGLISNKKQYMALSTEIEKIYNLINSWHMSTPDACRFIAKRTPSKVFSDFLDRFAHALESGEDPEEFLTIEQDVVMREFEILFKGSLSRIGRLQEMYMSLVMSLLFMGSMGIIMPLITGSDPIGIVGMTTFLFLFMEVMMLFMVKSKAPKDSLWHTLDKTDQEKKMMAWYPMMFVLVAIIGIISIVFLSDILEPQLILAVSIAPLAVPGAIFGRQEKKIKRADDNYPSFIRSLGSSSASRGGIVEYALKELRLHDFGALTTAIRNLYVRLSTGINKMLAWHHFSLETGSNLIQRCNEMFIESVDIGGKPDKIGNIISDNFIHIISLRKLRYDAGAGITGTLYGLIGGVSATLYLSLAVVEKMEITLSEVDLPEGAIGGLLSGEFNFFAVNILLMIILFGHSVISSFLIRAIDGGSPLTAPIHIIGMYWTGAITSVLTVNGMGDMIGGGSGMVQV